jgi:hypothetical protein
MSILLAACGGGGGSSSTPTAAATISPTVSVDVKKAWTDTGFAVTSGESIGITATGTMTSGECSSNVCNYTPAGAPGSTSCTGIPPGAFTAPALPCWSLIGKIGTNGSPFEVGDSLQTTASAAGELYLGVNDNYYPDNTGSWTATISL